MEPITLGLIGFACALVMLALRVPISFTLAGVSSSFIFLFFLNRGMDFERALKPTLTMISGTAYDLVHSYDLSMIPLFILLGHIAYHTGMTSDIYKAARVWLMKLPGGVAMASVLGCGGFSAISGSSMACASAMGRICVPEMLEAKYDKKLASASVAVGGTLGSLITPSVLFILYGIFTEVSINQLFMAGVLPGIISMLAYLLVIFIWVKSSPGVAPGIEGDSQLSKLKVALDCWPVLLLFFIIIGGIYSGFFTATEAAGVSTMIAVIVGVKQKKLNMAKFLDSVKETCLQSTSIFFIAAGAKIFVGFIALTGIAPEIAETITSMDLSVWMLLIMIAVIYFVLGMFLDPLGIMVLTLPFLIPMVEGYGLNLIWFGVIIVKLLEISLITPPVGLNVFVIGSVVRGQVSVGEIFMGVTRFLLADLLVLAAIIAFPIISLLLPNTSF